MKWIVRGVVTATVAGLGIVTVSLSPGAVQAQGDLGRLHRPPSEPALAAPAPVAPAAPVAAAPAPDALASTLPVLSDAKLSPAVDTASLATEDAASLPPIAMEALRFGDGPGPDWVPPEWLGHAPDLYAVPQLDDRGAHRGPDVRTRSVIVFDLDAGHVLYERNADDVRPVASVTKLVSALALVRAGGDLEATFCVDKRQYPSRNGARSHLSTGDCLSGWDVLGAALVASDNRAAYGLATVAGLDLDDFVAQMNAVSAELGMTRSSWSDPSGLEDENLSTARDIARATVAVAAHPVLSSVASAPYWDLLRTNAAGPRRLHSTDRLAAREDLLVEAAKTGYTDTARYCFTTAVVTPEGHRIVVTLLGAEGKLTRWGDMERILQWVDESA